MSTCLLLSNLFCIPPSIGNVSNSIYIVPKSLAIHTKICLKFAFMIICSTSSSHMILGSPCKYGIGFIGIGLAIRVRGHKTTTYFLLCSGSLFAAAFPIPKGDAQVSWWSQPPRNRRRRRQVLYIFFGVICLTWSISFDS